MVSVIALLVSDVVRALMYRPGSEVSSSVLLLLLLIYHRRLRMTL